jgi:signal transduction histidine kinase
LIAVSQDARNPIFAEVHPTVLAGHTALYEVAASSYLGVPLLMKGHLLGAITICAPPHRKYSATDREMAEQLSQRAALAIENARLYRGAREALEARDEFLSIAAHEIRGPVHAIRLSIQSMRKLQAATRPPQLELVERQSRRLSQFVDELLHIGQIRAGQLHLDYEEVNLGDVIRDVSVEVGPDLTRSGSSLTVTARGPVVGRWDKSRVVEVVSNLLANAIKFGLGKPIEVIAGTEEGQAILIVKDHGIGIQRDVQSRLFKPFERGVSARHYGGLGLGLHIVKTIVEALRGSISMESQPGAGSTFSVRLPQVPLEGGVEAQPAH